MQIVVISGSLSDASSSTALGERILEEFRRTVTDETGGAEPVEEKWISLRTLAHPIVDNLLTGFPPPPVLQAVDSLAGADAIVAVTPTYQASYSGLFKIFIDVLPEGIAANKPVLLAATGGTGRHGLVIDHGLRPLFSYLGSLIAPTGIYAATQDWGDAGLEKTIGFEEALDGRIKRGARQLWTLTKCGLAGPAVPFEPAGEGRSKETSVDDATAAFPDFVDFETLLKKDL